MSCHVMTSHVMTNHGMECCRVCGIYKEYKRMFVLKINNIDYFIVFYHIFLSTMVIIKCNTSFYHIIVPKNDHVLSSLQHVPANLTKHFIPVAHESIPMSIKEIMSSVNIKG